jgi:hypothetical protein
MTTKQQTPPELIEVTLVKGSKFYHYLDPITDRTITFVRNRPITVARAIAEHLSRQMTQHRVETSRNIFEVSEVRQFRFVPDVFEPLVSEPHIVDRRSVDERRHDADVEVEA